MAKADELFGDEILFVPDNNKTSSDKFKSGEWKRPLQEGEYFGHILDVETKDVEYTKEGSTYKATVYNYKVKLAEENKSLNFTFGDEEYTGGEYVGRDVKAAGVFKFHTPKSDDDFVANPTGNKKYLWFCKNLDVEVKKAEREIDGKKVTVDIMPSLSEEDMVGKPIIAVIGRGRPFEYNGRRIKPWEVKFVKSWDEGEIRDFSEEIPF